MLISTQESRTDGRRRVSTGTLTALAAGLAVLAACSAPASRRAGGPIAEVIQASLESGRASFTHEEWDQLLAAGIRDGRVDYRHFQRHDDRLQTYLQRLAAADLESLAPGHLKALLINAYNALTIQSILDHPEVSSTRDIDGVWTTIPHRVGGFELTLDGIEHNLLRPYFRDPRVHFAVNCAALSCAPLPVWAYDGDRIDEQLDERTQAFLRDPRHVRVRDGVLEVSRYFEWYGDDFVAEEWSPRADNIALFVAAYAGADVADFVRSRDGRPDLVFLDYDWALNASVPPPDPDALPREASAPAADAGLVARLRDIITGWGPLGGIAYISLYAVLTVLFVPAWPLTVGAGAAYGVVWGTVLVSVGSVCGAAAAFLVARYLLRDRVARWVEGNARFAAIDRAVGSEGWKVVGLTRLSPIFPFNLLNYAYGLTAIGFWPYLLVSWLAMLPGTVLFVYIGAASVDVTEAVTGTADWGKSLLQVVGLLATLLVSILITRIARRALRDTAGQLDRETGPA